jgi:hypothetical protein
MIETAKNTWQNESFKVKDLFTFEKMENNNNNIIYADGILDVLINSAETLKYILSLNAEYVIINRINISDRTGYSIYKAYNVIDCVNFRFEENFLNQLIKDGSYSIINKVSNQYNLFILKNNKF